MQKKISFIINPSELGAGTRGASLGPEAIMAVARKRNNFLFGSYPIHLIPNINHLLDQKNEQTFAKHIDGVIHVYESLVENITQIIKENRFPFVIAGDHSSAGGTIAGIKKAYPDKILGVIWIDAHGDLHSPFTTPSGNIHGMPLATALGEDNLAFQRNAVDTATEEKWNKLKNLGGTSPKILAENLVFAAVRDTELEEDAIIDRNQIRNFKVDEIRLKGVELIAHEILEKLSNCDLIYISFDVDSMDPELTSHGTGTPVAGGISPQEAQELILHLLKSPKVICFELVEVNPCLDEKINKMAETAFEISQAIVDQLIKN